MIEIIVLQFVLLYVYCFLHFVCNWIRLYYVGDFIWTLEYEGHGDDSNNIDFCGFKL